MVKVQIEVDEDLDEWIAINSIRKGFHDKRMTIVSLLKELKELKEAKDFSKIKVIREVKNGENIG